MFALLKLEIPIVFSYYYSLPPLKEINFSVMNCIVEMNIFLFVYIKNTLNTQAFFYVFSGKKNLWS